jgi:hypothetical protein
MVRDGHRIDDDSPADALHDLRKRRNELRYLLELFGSLFPGSVVKPTVSALKGLQDVLGRFPGPGRTGRAAARTGRRARRPAGRPAALMAVGLVVENLHADQGAARAAFAERFDEFASSERLELVRSSFPKLDDP